MKPACTLFIILSFALTACSDGEEAVLSMSEKRIADSLTALLVKEEKPVWDSLCLEKNTIWYNRSFDSIYRVRKEDIEYILER